MMSQIKMSSVYGFTPSNPDASSSGVADSTCCKQLQTLDNYINRMTNITNQLQTLKNKEVAAKRIRLLITNVNQKIEAFDVSGLIVTGVSDSV